ncbi:MAG TPA: M14 family metallopeptidase [Bacteroidales bacterium]|nr:M14 family metallopeptidase [Bacteroidales bacterium]HPQ63418.1 M14 family metallopeptidase [Bacteroidales bacterium]
MKRALTAAAVAVAVTLSLSSQELMTPEQYLGYKPGEKFTLQHTLTDYFMHVAEHSPNASYIRYGETWEGRPLSACIISAPENLARLDQIIKSNLQRAGFAEGNPVTEPVPIIWLAYSVHGSEPAGAEAAMQVLHALVTRSWKGSEEWLEKMIIVIDPCQNPDGRDLFTTRYLRAQGWPPNSNPDAWEHHQDWPSSRLNHYLFDLNRDWSWHVQKETQARTKLYNSFMPHVYADFHEMGSESTYFFPPGADPWHEIITPWQKEFHSLTGKKTAELFDTRFRLYFTKENFDLFCPSFGDTWPLFNGAMGFTFEQGGGAQAGLSLARETQDTLTLRHRVEGHFLSSMAVIATAAENSEKLLTSFYEYFGNATTNPECEYKTIIIKGSADAASLESLIELLESNQIRYSSPQAAGKKIKAFEYRSGAETSLTIEENDLLISAYQPQGRLIQVMFEPASRSSDSVSYDLTAWALPYVYNIEVYASKERLTVTERKSPKASLTAASSSEEPADTLPVYAWAASMTGFNELKFMGKLFRSGLNVRSSHHPFTVAGKTFNRGSVVVARGDNSTVLQFNEKVKAAAAASGVKLVPLTGGMVSTGKDLGSGYSPAGKGPRIALAGGEGASQAFGEIWFFLERELEYPVTVVKADKLKEMDLSEYDVLILPGGSLTEAKEKIMQYVKEGGKVVALDSAIALFRGEKSTALGKAYDAREAEEKKNVKATFADTTMLQRYEDRRRLSVTGRSAGAIFRVQLDDSHPFAFGMGKEWFLMKRNEGLPFLEKGNNIGYITDTIPVSGFAGYKYLKKVKNTGVIASETIGKGTVVYISEDPYFRAYWKSGRVLLGNIFFR